jgi:2,3-bisphosphoglycerate-independent phosphoglycerate mutase
MSDGPGKTPLADAIRQAYGRGEEDETLPPLHLVDGAGQPLGLMGDGDSVIFYNIRGEREVELSLSLTQPGFAQFPTRDGMTVRMATMIEYDPRITEHVAFPPGGALPDTLSEVVSRAGLRHAKVVESEKAVHLTYFLNGKRKGPFPGEERVVIESNREVNDFDELPEMDVAAVVAATVERLADPGCALIVANFANMDVVGHIEDKGAVLAAIQAVDAAVGEVVRAAQAAGVTAVVTADHGSVERWYYPEGAINTGHTDSPVPCVVAREGLALRVEGDLTDVAPTVLALMGLEAPAAMTGRSLLEVAPQETGRVLLLIVDGWGLHDDPAINLVAQAETPSLDWLRATYPGAVLQAAGEVVGMPAGSVGNSECGHLHIGAGRRVLSDRMQITQAIESGAYHDNPAFNWAIDEALHNGRRLHLLGIISFYSSHGSLKYLRELLQLCARRGVPEVYVHGMLGRRGERPEAGAVYVGEIEALCAELGCGRVVSVIGRHWALDREEHWDRVERAYRMLTYGEGEAVAGG